MRLRYHYLINKIVNLLIACRYKPQTKVADRMTLSIYIRIPKNEFINSTSFTYKIVA